MQEIPKTFCPAKWEDLMINFESGIVYSCCKSLPTEIHDSDLLKDIKKQRENLLNGIQDPSCNYCWHPEKTPGTNSRRHIYLNKMESADISDYVNNTVPLKYIEFNIGNQCNFQCVYCKPTFSSQWESDVRKKPYTLFTDRYSYELPTKKKQVFEKNLTLLKEHTDLRKVGIIGGEPLYNKNFLKLLPHIQTKWLGLTTNLSCSKKILLNFLHECKRFEHVILTVSLDSTDKIAEFTRYGLDFAHWKENFEYLLDNRPDNMVVQVNSLLTSVTVRDIENFSKFMLPYLSKVKWHINFCIDPQIQGFATLPEHYKPAIIKCLESINTTHNIDGIGGVISALKQSKFSPSMHKELILFMNDFARRKNLQIPICLD